MRCLLGGDGRSGCVVATVVGGHFVVAFPAYFPANEVSEIGYQALGKFGVVGDRPGEINCFVSTLIESKSTPVSWSSSS